MEKIIDGLKIYYVDSAENGDSIVESKGTVLILQGWGTDLHVYDSVAACIEEKYRVIRVDFPGFGKSDEPKEPWPVDGFADFTESFVKELGIDNFTLIGHSYGGRVIIKLADRESRGALSFTIKNIVLIDSAGVLPEKTPAQKRKIAKYKMLKKMVDNSLVHGMFPELVDDWKSRQGSADYRNATPIMRSCLVMAVNEDLTGLFPNVKKEVLLIWGDGDTATPISDAKKMEELMPDAGLAIIPGTGHFCFLENPGQFRSIMRSYFRMED